MKKKFQINLGIRLKNKLFWLSLIPAVVFFIQAICALVGIDIDFTSKQEQLATVIEALFSVLAILGVVNDPTTEGISDSDNAMKYVEPKER